MTRPEDALSQELAEARFRRLYAEHGREVLAYALRRTSGPEDAADAVAETFLVAWRRGAEVPPGPEARLWLYGVARLTLANQRRGENRRARLSERLRTDLAEAIAAQPEPDQGEGAVLSALALLDSDDREILQLTAWEELTPAQAGRTLEISAVAARSRLHRARRRLRRVLAASDSGATPIFDPTPEEEQ
jgi:RNA polymerase sigma-70 factor (ECF subfamily)